MLARVFAMLMFVGGFFLLAPSANAQRPDNRDSQPEYILLLTADGFRSDYIEWYQPPNMMRLISEGVRVLYSTNVFPTLTTPNMTSLVTGARPRTTGIAANAQYVKELDRIVAAPRDNKAETIAETLQKAGWRTAGVNQFMLQNRGTDVYAATGYEESEASTTVILDILRTNRARFVGAIYGATDKAGHRYGPRSEEVKSAVLEIDRAVGRLVDELRKRGIFERTLLVFSSDHGMSPFAAKQASIEPAEALRKEGFRVATSAAELSAETQVVVLSYSVRLVYFRDVTPEQKEKALAVLSRIEGAEVLGRERLDELGCHDNRSGDVIVSPLPGYVMSGAGRPGGLHGQFDENNPILFFRGPGVGRGVVLPGAENIDVVPTILKMVNVKPAASVEGKVIAGVAKTD